MNQQNIQEEGVDPFYDKKMNIEIDNGNHLVFSANKNFKEFCEIIGSSKT